MRTLERALGLCFRVHHKQFNSLQSRLELRTLYERNGSPLSRARADVAQRTIGSSVCPGHADLNFVDGGEGAGCLTVAEGNACCRAASCGIAQRAGAEIGRASCRERV